MFRIAIRHFWLCIPLCVGAQTAEPTAVKTENGKPALIATVELADFDSLPKLLNTLTHGQAFNPNHRKIVEITP